MIPDIEETATEEDAAWRSPHPRVVVAAAVFSLAVAVPAAIALARFLVGKGVALDRGVAAAAAAALLVVGAAAVYETARRRATRYRLTGRRLELHSGIWTKEYRAVPRERVRSVDVTADPVRRVLGLAVVKVGTGEKDASGGPVELTLDALAVAEAEALRGILLGGRAERPDDGPLAELRWSWIRYAPLTVWTFVGGGLALGGLYKLLDTLGFEPAKWETAARAWEWITATPWITVPLLLAANALLGFAGAAVLYAESWGRYRLERRPGVLRLRRGLLTTRSLTLEERRLRGVAVTEPLLLRLGGGARVTAVTTGLRKAEESATEEVAALTPPLPAREARRIASAVLGEELDPAGLRGHPRAARGRRVRRALVAAAALAAALGVLDAWTAWVPAWAWALPVLAVPAGWALAAEGYRSLGHGLTRRYLVTRTGAVRRRTVALDRSGIIGLTISESLFQRRAGLVTLSATTAAGEGRYDVLDVGRDEGLRLARHAVPGLLEPFVEESC
ncbi:PH domain-containing protein [Microtetraspora malaysiensis]|uniref:PH domain-containing protein n=1 Tax=Microtetraspora malaysiensis TaxID=161358 RepID=A0ABW6SZD0_9ACTN